MNIEPKCAGNKSIVDPKDKRTIRTNLNAQLTRQEQRERIKALQREFVELITNMHESDITTKEWVTWLHFETQFLRAKIDSQSNLITELTLQIIDLKKMI